MRGFETNDELPDGEIELKPKEKQFYFLKRICSAATHKLDVPHTVELRRKPKEELIEILKRSNLKPVTFQGYDVELTSQETRDGYLFRIKWTKKPDKPDSENASFYFQATLKF